MAHQHHPLLTMDMRRSRCPAVSGTQRRSLVRGLEYHSAPHLTARRDCSALDTLLPEVVVAAAAAAAGWGYGDSARQIGWSLILRAVAARASSSCRTKANTTASPTADLTSSYLGTCSCNSVLAQTLVAIFLNSFPPFLNCCVNPG